MKELKEDIEEILRNQFVDRAYSKSGKTTWGVDETRDELLALFTQHDAQIRREAVEGFVEGLRDIYPFGKIIHGRTVSTFHTYLVAQMEAYLKQQESIK